MSFADLQVSFYQFIFSRILLSSLLVWEIASHFGVNMGEAKVESSSRKSSPPCKGVVHTRDINGLQNN